MADPFVLAPGGGRRRNPALTGGLVLLALLVALALAAPLLSGFDPAEQLDPVAGRFLPPGSERILVRFADGRTLLAEAAAVEGDLLVYDRLGSRDSRPLGALAADGGGGAVARRRFPLGTDRFGRDLWSRLAHGARVSLAVGMLAALLAVSLGTAVGAVAATGGRLADALLMRGVDAMLSLPRMFLVLAVVALFRPGTWALVAILGGTGWMLTSRMVRAELRALERREFILAARGIGLGRLAVLFRHLLPNALTPVLVQLGLLVGDAILAESTLSFLGLGIPPPTASWGNLIAGGSDRLLDAWWLSTFPGLAIALTVVAFNLVADGLRDALDPRRG